jgi:hypothetical protein
MEGNDWNCSRRRGDAEKVALSPCRRPQMSNVDEIIGHVLLQVQVAQQLRLEVSLVVE